MVKNSKASDGNWWALSYGGDMEMGIQDGGVVFERIAYVSHFDVSFP